ncbi:MAG: TRAP transporter small permease [SAR324 cluster bacterium]|nr:TRAP transporter small permease [SAR324 cluster bacterium]
MQEFLTVLLVAAASGIAIFFLAAQLDIIAWQIEQGLNLCANALILFAMGFVVSEVVLRTAFNAPIPGHLELSELMVPAIIFLALAYTQSTGGHVQMSLVVDMLPPAGRRLAEIFSLTLSVAIYSLLTYFSLKHFYREWIYDNVTMQYLYVTWPSTLAVSIGFFFSTLRLYLDLLKEIFPTRVRRETVYIRTQPGGE